MLKEFKEFISKGNLVEIAVALILASRVRRGWSQSLHREPDQPDHRRDLRAAQLRQPRDRDRATPNCGTGRSSTTLLNFLIVAFVLFLVVKAYNRAFPKKEAAAGPTEIELLTEIRDELRQR